LLEQLDFCLELFGFPVRVVRFDAERGHFLPDHGGQLKGQL
jgi:hypothetical protein